MTKISYGIVTKKGGKEIKSFEDAAGLSFEGGTGISVSNAIEAWNERIRIKRSILLTRMQIHLYFYSM